MGISVLESIAGEMKERRSWDDCEPLSDRWTQWYH